MYYLCIRTYVTYTYLKPTGTKSVMCKTIVTLEEEEGKMKGFQDHLEWFKFLKIKERSETNIAKN